MCIIYCIVLTLLGESPLTADIRLERESDYGSDEEETSLLLQSNYVPRKALAVAIVDWMEEIHSQYTVKPKKTLTISEPQSTSAPTPGINTCMVPTMTTTSTLSSSHAIPVPSTSTVPNLNELINPEVSDSYLQPLANQKPVNSLIDSGTDTDEDSHSDMLEPMDCVVTPGTTPVSTTDSIPPAGLPPCGAPESSTSLPQCVHKDDSVCDSCSECRSSVVSCDSMQVDSVQPLLPTSNTSTTPSGSGTVVQQETPLNERCLLTSEDIHLLVDLFYLPFEHGSVGVNMLQEIHYLKMNAHIITEVKFNAEEEQIAAATEWRERAQKFQEVVSTIGRLTERLCNSPNQGLIYDLYPYVWDLWATAALAGSFVEWLGIFTHLCYVRYLAMKACHL